MIQQILDKYGNKFTTKELEGITTKGDPEKLKLRLVEELCKFRNWHGYKTMILSGYRKGDPRTHGKGLAFDQVLWDEWGETQPNEYEIYRLLTTYPWHGAGIYFDIEYNNKPVVMIHTDLGEENRPLRWIRHKGNYFYERSYNEFEHKSGRVITLQSAIQSYRNLTGKQ